MSDLDLLERELTESFERAHQAPQWALPSWPDAAGRVRRAAIRARARRVTAATAVVAAVTGGAVVSAAALTTTDAQVHYRTLSGGDGGGATGQTGAQWLLSSSDYAQYTAAHPSPSAAPDLVPSPAPRDAELTQLQTDIAAALPAGATTVRADAADGGVRGQATVWLRLTDGTPVAVERHRLGYPLDLNWPEDTTSDGQPSPVTEHFTDPAAWADGTAYTVVTGTLFGYGFGAGTEWNGPTVWTVTPDGWFTMWTAPVSVDKLLSWARSADDSFAAG